MAPPVDRYSHGHHASVLRSHRWRTVANSAAFLAPHLATGMALLDVGCGPGTITAELAGLVAPGKVIGIDAAAGVIELARDEHGSGQSGNLEFEVGDVYALRFADATFDVVYAHQVLQHLSDPITALREMHRVLRPGGILAIRDADFSAFTWSPRSSELDEWMVLYQAVTERNHADANAGRSLGSWAVEAGFHDVVATTSTWIFESPEDRAWWGGLWAERTVSSDFAAQAVSEGLATSDDLARIAGGFLSWAAEPTGRFVLPNGEVLARR